MPRLGNRPISRALVALVLLSGLGGIAVHYGSVMEACPEPSETIHCPRLEALQDEYDQYVGEQVTVSGTVVGTGPLTLRLSNSETIVLMTVSGVRTSAQPGDKVSVYGELQPDYHVAATGIVVHAAESRRMMFAVSVIAILLTSLVCIRYWTVDTGAFTVRPRR